MSAVPAALAALVATFTASKPAALQQVIDGPPYDPPNTFLAVGWDRSDQPAVSVQRDSGSAGYSERETFEVSCLLSFGYDDPEVTTVRQTAFTVFEALCATLAADRTLGDVVMTSAVTAYEFTQTLTEAGAIADLRFTVTVRADGLI